MEAAESPLLQAQDTGELLTAITDELRSIGSIPARQNERIESLSKAKDRALPKEWDSVSLTVGSQCPMVSHLISSYAQDSESLHITDSISSNSTASISNTISTELRTGLILQEALTRYNLDSIPAWSPFYGTHLLHGEGPETSEDSIRNSEWAAAIGEFWKIPHETESTSVSELECPGQRLCFECGTLSPNSINYQLSILPKESSSIFGIGLMPDFQHTGIRERQQRSSPYASQVGWLEAVRSMLIHFLSPRWSHLGEG